MDARLSVKTAFSAQHVASSGIISQDSQQPQPPSASGGAPPSSSPTSPVADVSTMARDAHTTNEKLFPLLQKGLADPNLGPYMHAAGKLIGWMGRSDAFYTAARPRIVTFLEVAQHTLCNVSGITPSPNYAFHISLCPQSSIVGHFMKTYVALVQAVQRYEYRFVESELRRRLAVIFRSIDPFPFTMGNASPSIPPFNHTPVVANSPISPATVQPVPSTSTSAPIPSSSRESIHIVTSPIIAPFQASHIAQGQTPAPPPIATGFIAPKQPSRPSSVAEHPHPPDTSPPAVSAPPPTSSSASVPAQTQAQTQTPSPSISSASAHTVQASPTAQTQGKKAKSKAKKRASALAAVAFDYLNSDLEWYVKQKEKGKGKEVDSDVGVDKKDGETVPECPETVAVGMPSAEQGDAVKESEQEQEKRDTMDIETRKESEAMDTAYENKRIHQESLLEPMQEPQTGPEEMVAEEAEGAEVIKKDAMVEQTPGNDKVRFERSHDEKEAVGVMVKDNGEERDNAIEVEEDAEEVEEAERMVVDDVPVERQDETREAERAEDKEQEVEAEVKLKADGDVQGQTQEETTVRGGSATPPEKDGVSSAAPFEGVPTSTQEEEMVVEANVVADEDIASQVQPKAVNIDETAEQGVEQPTHTESKPNDVAQTGDSAMLPAKIESKHSKRKHTGESSATPKRKKKRRGPPGISPSEFRRMFPQAHMSKSRESSPETTLIASLANSSARNIEVPAAQRKRSQSESSESDAPLAKLVVRRNMSSSPAKRSLKSPDADDPSPGLSHDVNTMQEPHTRASEQTTRQGSLPRSPGRQSLTPILDSPEEGELRLSPIDDPREDGQITLEISAVPLNDTVGGGPSDDAQAAKEVDMSSRSIDSGPITYLLLQPSVPPPTARNVLFDNRMVVLGAMRGAPRSQSITLSCELNAKDVSALRQWNDRAKLFGDRSELRCLSLACHSYAECSAMLDDDTFDPSAAFSQAPVHWPIQTFPTATFDRSQHASDILPITPLSIDPDNLVDVSSRVRDGRLHVELMSTYGDTIDYIFVLHFHPPTVHQLEQLAKRQSQDAAWKQLLASFTSIKMPEVSSFVNLDTAIRV